MQWTPANQPPSQLAHLAPLFRAAKIFSTESARGPRVLQQLAALLQLADGAHAEDRELAPSPGVTGAPSGPLPSTIRVMEAARLLWRSG